MAFRSAIVMLVRRGAGFLALLLLCAVGTAEAYDACPSGQIRVFSATNDIGSNSITNRASDSQVCSESAPILDAGLSSAYNVVFTSVTVLSGTTFRCNYNRTYASDGSVAGTMTSNGVSSCAAATCSTASGTVKWFAGSQPPGNLCAADHCNYTIGETWDLPSTPSANQSKGISTGTVCTSTPGTEAAGPPITAGSLTLGDYNTGTKCGTVNGSTVCVGSLGNQQCAKVSGGFGVCVLSGSTASTSALTSPQAPNNGTAGIPASADVVIRDHTNGLTGAIYLPGTVSHSTSNPGPAPGGDDNGDGVCQTGETCSKQQAECGVSGKPACSVKVDETGTPDGSGVHAPSFDQDGGNSDIKDAAASNPASGWDVGSILPSFGSHACQSLSFDIGHGRSWVIPGSSACAFLDDLKAIVAFFLYLFTATSILQRVFSEV